jgi:rSAM/selenodomain-associated transferase 2
MVRVATRLKLSVIVPVGPAERAWPALLGDLAPLDTQAEIVLVSVTGEAPREFDAARYGLRAPARWLETAAGRARQQNAGAAVAQGESLWFLHADSRVPAETVKAALDFAGRDGLGYFQLRFMDDGPALARLNALGARIRSRWLGLPFGDQGLMLARERFELLGGFDESLSCGEDHALVWAARRAGVPLVPLPSPVLTSARRYADRGWLRTTLRHARLTVAQAWQHSGAGARRAPK